MVMAGVKFAVCLSVCQSVWRHILRNSWTTWLKFCTGMDVCGVRCVSHFDGNRCMQGSRQGSSKCTTGDIVSVLQWSACGNVIVSLCLWYSLLYYFYTTSAYPVFYILRNFFAHFLEPSSSVCCRCFSRSIAIHYMWPSVQLLLV